MYQIRNFSTVHRSQWLWPGDTARVPSDQQLWLPPGQLDYLYPGTSEEKGSHHDGKSSWYWAVGGIRAAITQLGGEKHVWDPGDTLGDVLLFFYNNRVLKMLTLRRKDWLRLPVKLWWSAKLIDDGDSEWVAEEGEAKTRCGPENNKSYRSNSVVHSLPLSVPSGRVNKTMEEAHWTYVEK